MPDIKELISQAKPTPPSKFIVMGDPMTGKTTLAAKAPRPLFLSTDGNAAKAGLAAVEATSLEIVREVIKYFSENNEYETLVIDTVEGIADLIEKSVIAKYNADNTQEITALSDVPFGRLIRDFNQKVGSFAEVLLRIPKNVVVLTYTKRQVDDLSGGVVLSSEIKGIRHFTKFADGVILTTFDGDRYEARVVSKRTTLAGKVDFGSIEDFLQASGWNLPTKKVKLGSTKKG